MEPQVHYASRFQQHRFVISAARPIWDPTKTAIVAYDPGKEIRFERGRYATADAEEIAFLDKAIGRGSPDLMRLTAEEAGEAPSPDGVAVVPFSGTKNTTASPKEYRCAVCGLANFTGPNAVLAYGRHMAEHKRETKKAEKAAKAATATSG